MEVVPLCTALDRLLSVWQYVCDLCRSCLCYSYPVLMTQKWIMDYDIGVLCAPDVFLYNKLIDCELFMLN